MSEQHNGLVVTDQERIEADRHYGRRNVRRMRVRLTTDVQNGQAVPTGEHGCAVLHGTAEFLVYRDQFEREIRPLIRTPEQCKLWEHAQEMYRAEVAGFLKDNPRKSEKQYTGNAPAAIFYSLNGRRDLPPIAACEILEDDVDPPEMPETTNARQMAQYAKIQAEALRAVLGGKQDTSEVDAMRAEIADLKQLVKGLAKAPKKAD